MLTATKLAKFLADREKELFKLKQHAVSDDPPEPEPEPPKLEPARKGETDMERMLRCARNDIAAGRAISANMMRSTPRPPRRPGQQRQQYNGLWGWWS